MSDTQKCKNTCQSLDLYGAQPSLCIFGQQKYSSIFGIILTSIAGILTIAYLYSEVKELIEKQLPTTIQSDHQVLETSAFPLMIDNFTLAISVVDVNQNPLQTINKYFTINVQNCLKTRTLNNSTNKVEVSNVCITYPTEACNSEHFVTQIQKDYFSKIRLGAAQCIKKDVQVNNPPKLQGIVSGNNYAYLSISFQACKNSTIKTDCAPQSDIDAALLSGYYIVHMSDSLLQMNRPENIQSNIIKLQFTTFSISSSKTIFQAFRIIDSQTDVGDISSEIQEDLFLIQQNYRESTTNYNGDYIVQHFLILDDKYSLYERSYIKLVTILSKIGGLWNIVFLLFGMISKPFIQTEMKINLSNKLFRFQIEKNQGFDTTVNISKKDTQNFHLQSTKLNFEKYLQHAYHKLPNNILNIFLMSLGCNRVRLKQLQQANSKIQEKLDVAEIVGKLQELEKLKFILLTENQRTLFDFIPIPQVKLDQVQPQNEISTRNGKSLNYDVEVDKKKDSFDKFQDACKSYQRIKLRREKNQNINQKIIQYLDVDIIRLFEEISVDEEQKQEVLLQYEIRQSKFQSDGIVRLDSEPKSCFSPQSSIGIEDRAAKVFINKKKANM